MTLKEDYNPNIAIYAPCSQERFRLSLFALNSFITPEKEFIHQYFKYFDQMPGGELWNAIILKDVSTVFVPRNYKKFVVPDFVSLCEQFKIQVLYLNTDSQAYLLSTKTKFLAKTHIKD